MIDRKERLRCEAFPFSILFPFESFENGTMFLDYSVIIELW